MKHRKALVIFLMIAAILALVAFGAGSLWGQDSYSENNVECELQVTIKNKTFNCVELVDTPAERIQGLSGTPNLTSDEAMLFLFEEPAPQGIWMKNMVVELDIIWADELGVVTHIKTDVSPLTCPQPFDQNNCQVFRSEEPALYVLEVMAGQVTANDIKVGDTIVQL